MRCEVVIYTKMKLFLLICTSFIIGILSEDNDENNCKPGEVIKVKICKCHNRDCEFGSTCKQDETKTPPRPKCFVDPAKYVEIKGSDGYGVKIHPKLKFVFGVFDEGPSINGFRMWYKKKDMSKDTPDKDKCKDKFFLYVDKKTNTWGISDHVFTEGIMLFNEKIPPPRIPITTNMNDSHWKYSINGKWNTDRNFEIILHVGTPGHWCEWPDWGQCSVTCGGGIREVVRICACNKPTGKTRQHCRDDGSNATRGENCAENRCTELQEEESGALNMTKSSATRIGGKNSNNIICLIICILVCELVNFYR